jgi:hypothetical protein
MSKPDKYIACYFPTGFELFESIKKGWVVFDKEDTSLGFPMWRDVIVCPKRDYRKFVLKALKHPGNINNGKRFFPMHYPEGFLLDGDYKGWIIFDRKDKETGPYDLVGCCPEKKDLKLILEVLNRTYG